MTGGERLRFLLRREPPCGSSGRRTAMRAAWISTLALVLALGVTLTLGPGWTSDSRSPTTIAAGTDLVSAPRGSAPIPLGPPLLLEENRGQFPASARFVARGPGTTLSVEDRGLTLRLPRHGRQRPGVGAPGARLRRPPRSPRRELERGRALVSHPKAQPPARERPRPSRRVPGRSLSPLRTRTTSWPRPSGTVAADSSCSSFGRKRMTARPMRTPAR